MKKNTKKAKNQKTKKAEKQESKKAEKINDQLKLSHLMKSFFILLKIVIKEEIFYLMTPKEMKSGETIIQTFNFSSGEIVKQYNYQGEKKTDLKKGTFYNSVFGKIDLSDIQENIGEGIYQINPVLFGLLYSFNEKIKFAINHKLSETTIAKRKSKFYEYYDILEKAENHFIESLSKKDSIINYVVEPIIYKKKYAIRFTKKEENLTY